MMTIGLGGPGEDDDPFWLVPGAFLDAPVLVGPLGKQRREDLQLWSFLLALGQTVAGDHPLGVSHGEDPPDRYLTTGSGRRWAFELTELTLQDVRSDLARVRRFGRQLEVALGADKQFAHLVGRRIVVSPSEATPPARPDESIGPIIEALQTDRGCVGDDLDLSTGELPKFIPGTAAGFYGRVGDFIVQMYGDGPPDAIAVSASAQAEIRLSEAVSALAQRVDAKDVPGNEVLLITCSMPDAGGYVCPLESFIFQFVVDHAGRGLTHPPTHLQHIAIHRWGTIEWSELYRSAGEAGPWPTRTVD